VKINSSSRIVDSKLLKGYIGIMKNREPKNQIIPKKPDNKRNSIDKPESFLSKDFLLMMLGAMGLAFMNQIYLASLPLYMDKLGKLAFHAGLLSTVYGALAIVTRPVAGVLYDRVGRKKMLITGAAICAVACFFFSQTTVLLVLLLIRSFHGIGFGMYSTCAGAGAADIIPKKRLAEGMGIFFLYATISQAAGPGIAVAIIGGGSDRNYKTLFFVTAAICLVSTIASCCVTNDKTGDGSLSQADERQRTDPSLIPDEKQEPGTPPQNDSGTPPQIDSEPLPKTLFGFEYALFAPVFVYLLYNMGIVSLMGFLTKYAAWKGFGNPGLYFFVNASSVLLSRFFLGKIADKRSADTLVIPSMIIISLCIALIPSMRSLAAIIVIALPIGLAHGSITPAFSAMLFNRCSVARRGIASASFFIAIDLGVAIGAPLLGAVADAFDYRYIYWVAAVIVALSLLLYLLICSERLYNKKKATTQM